MDVYKWQSPRRPVWVPKSHSGLGLFCWHQIMILRGPKKPRSLRKQGSDLTELRQILKKMEKLILDDLWGFLKNLYRFLKVWWMFLIFSQWTSSKENFCWKFLIFSQWSTVNVVCCEKIKNFHQAEKERKKERRISTRIVGFAATKKWENFLAFITHSAFQIFSFFMIYIKLSIM